MAYFSSDGDDISRISPTYVSPGVWRDPPDAMPGDEYDYMDGFPGDTLIAGDLGATMDGRWGATLIGGAGSDTMTRGGYMAGNGGDDDMSDGVEMDGGDGDDRLTNGDLMSGGNGNDILIDGSDMVGGPGDDYLQASDYVPGQGSLDGDEGNDTLIGSGGDDYMYGGDGNDILDGRGGYNQMDGGAGDDLFLVQDELTPITEVAGGGYDTVRSTVSFVLADNVERLTLIGPYALDGTGNASNNLIEGNEYGNVLSGLAGNDVLTGGDGNDTMDGGAGDDTLDGGAGADKMTGGRGNDTFIVDDPGDVVHDTAGIDTVQASVSYTLPADIENLVLTGSAVSGTGNAAANKIVGNSANNVLSGGGGDDTLNGGAGDDVLDGGAGADDMGGGLGSDLYIVDNVGDVAEESNGDGAIDTVRASVSFTLSKNIEDLALTGSQAIDGTGNARDNVMQGNGAANVLAGKGGADTLTGGGAADTFQFDTPLVAGVVTTITDMTHGVDKIALDHTVFAAAGPIGRLDSKAYFVGAAANDASDRIIYNIATGELSYDPDGGKAQPGTVFAHVAPGLALNAGDFKIV